MAAVENSQLIFIKRVKKRPHSGGHHGGAWKVAYADFVTAMMAFFLLLWLLNATTEEQKSGISDYFAPASVSKTKSGSGGIMGGKTMSEEGAKASTTASPNVTISIPVPGRSDEESEDEVESEKTTPNSSLATESDEGSTTAKLAFGEGEKLSFAEGEKQPGSQEARGEVAGAQTQTADDHAGALAPDDEVDGETLARLEQEEFAHAEEQLRKALERTPELAEFAENLLVDETPEGLRIQLIDRDKREMFPIGSAQMYDHTHKLIEQITQVIAQMPNRISVSGHTDATPYRTDSGYGNWELSSDRANASRRALIDAGLDPGRIVTVVGKADTDPLFPDDPTAAGNRRISIVLLRERFSSRADLGASPLAAADAGAEPASAASPESRSEAAPEEPPETAPEGATPTYYSPKDTVESALPYGG